MKVVCIDNLYDKLYDRDEIITLPITIDKVYDVVDYSDSCYVIITDDGDEQPYYHYRFKTLYEVRDEKISKLLE